VFQNSDDEREQRLHYPLANALNYLSFKFEALQLSQEDIPDLAQLRTRILEMENLEEQNGETMPLAQSNPYLCRLVVHMRPPFAVPFGLRYPSHLCLSL
jgi:hypothetical protein